MTSKRLCILSSEFPPGPGGIGTHAYQIAINLKKLGWEVSVVTREDYVDEAERARFIQQQGFEIIALHPKSNLLSEFIYRSSVVLKHLRQQNPEVIIATGERMVWLCALLAFFHRKVWVAIGHGTEFNTPSKWRRILTRWSFNRADAVVCVSRFTTQKLQDLGIHPRLLKIIPNGADEALYHQMPQEALTQYRRSQGWDGAKLLITVGRVCERKGQDTVIAALPSILAEFPNVHYLLVGLPEEQARFSQLAEQLGVLDHVHFLGRLPNEQLPLTIGSADIFVMLSREAASGDIEGYGIAVVEAALCGVPAVVSDGSGLVEAIEPDVTGLAVPANDPVSAAKAITRLLRDETQRKHFAAHARGQAIREKTWFHAAQQYDSLLQSSL